MLRFLPLLLLAPFGVLTHPTAGQLVFQFSDSPAIEHGAAPPSSSAVQLVYEFQNLTRLENLAARSNGHLVLTAVNEPFLYDIDPTAHHPSPNLLHIFSGVTSLTGRSLETSDVPSISRLFQTTH